MKRVSDAQGTSQFGCQLLSEKVDLRLDFTKLTAEKVDPPSQVVLNTFKTFPTMELSLGFYILNINN